MPVPILYAPSADFARALLLQRPVLLTVEAEYGSYVAEGTRYTAAHHQPAGTKYAGRHLPGGTMPSPCNSDSIPVLTEEDAAAGGAVLVSHFDLDTVGGCLRSMPAFQDLFPRKPAVDDPEVVGKVLKGIQTGNFWDLAEFVDVRGAHKLVEAPTTARALKQLYAFWAWSKTSVPRYPRDRISDVTPAIVSAGEALRRIFNDDVAMLEAGQVLRDEEAALNARTFLRRAGMTILRVADKSADFCNHLYVTPTGEVVPSVASYNRESGSVTISLADPVPGVSCRDIVQKLWGPEAGGHDGIAGSPREKNVGEEGMILAAQALQKALLHR